MLHRRPILWRAAGKEMCETRHERRAKEREFYFILQQFSWKSMLSSKTDVSCPAFGQHPSLGTVLQYQTRHVIDVKRVTSGWGFLHLIQIKQCANTSSLLTPHDQGLDRNLTKYLDSHFQIVAGFCSRLFFLSCRTPGKLSFLSSSERIAVGTHPELCHADTAHLRLRITNLGHVCKHYRCSDFWRTANRILIRVSDLKEAVHMMQTSGFSSSSLLSPRPVATLIQSRHCVTWMLTGSRDLKSLPNSPLSLCVCVRACVCVCVCVLCTAVNDVHGFWKIFALFPHVNQLTLWLILCAYSCFVSFTMIQLCRCSTQQDYCNHSCQYTCLCSSYLGLVISTKLRKESNNSCAIDDP